MQEDVTMTHKPRASVTALAALLLLSAAAGAQVRTTGSDIRISKERAEVSTTPSVTTTTIVSGGEVTLTTPFDLSVYANKMTEKNITAHMAAGDSLEIELGRLAQTKGLDSRVRDYGTTLVNDHTAHLAKTIEIITDEDVGAEPMAFDPEGIRLREFLTRAREMGSGANWDAAFLRFQAQHHQNEIDILNSNIKNAHDDDLEDHIEKSLGSLAKHRDMARSVATQLGITAP
jgi:putative membrane protein